MVCLEWGNLTTVNNLYSQNIVLSIILITFDLFPKVNYVYFLPILIKCNVVI